jgi:hypothetical protein
VVALTLRLADPPALRAMYESHLSKGRAFVPGASGVAELQACELVLEHAGRSHRLRAEAVFVKAEDPGRGVGLQLAPLDAAGKADLLAFVEQAEQPEAPAPELPPEAPAEPEGDDRAAQNLQERIRRLSSTEQQRIAQAGLMAERIVLERTFGANVWEALLGNPRLTIPEVARIARKGTLPRPLIENIAGHPSWMAAAEVQRALLGNPRSTTAVTTKVLQAMTRGELQLVPQQTAYPQAVRALAKKMLMR